MEAASPLLISTNELNALLQGENKPVVLHATLDGDVDEIFSTARIPGAKHFCLQKIRDTSNPIPVMFPSTAQFITQMKELGVPKDAHIVIYDNHGFMPGPRVWFMFKAFGAPNVQILNGGLPKWTADKYPVESGPAKESAPVKDGNYDYVLKEDMIYNYEQIKALSADKSKPIVDARGKEMFDKGNIPNSVNIPVGMQFDQTTKEVKSKEALAELFKDRGVELNKPAVFTCQRAITACSAAFSYVLSGGKLEDVAVYDGAYAEFGSKK